MAGIEKIRVNGRTMNVSGSGSTGAVTSVNGMTGAVTITPANIGAAKSIHTHTTADITDFPEIGGFSPVLLWSHSATTAIDGGATTLDMSAYEWFIVEFATNTAETPSTYRQTILVRKGLYNKCSILYSTYIYWRMIYIYNDGFSLTNGNRTALSTGTNNEGVGYCIPVRIYGVG